MRGAPDPRASTGRLRGLTSLAKGSQLSRFPRPVVTPGSFHPSGTLRVHFPWSTSQASAVAGKMGRRRSRAAGTCVTICGAKSSCVNVGASGSPAGLSRRPRCDRGELSRRRPPAEYPHTPAAARGCPGAFRPGRIIPLRAAVRTGGLGTPSTRLAFDPCPGGRSAGEEARQPACWPAGRGGGHVLRIWRMVLGSPVRCRARGRRCAKATRRGRGRFLAHI